MGRNYGNSDIMAWNFKEIPIADDWKSHLGELSEGFRMIIQGPSGHGKTEYTMKIAKMLATHYGKVSYNSTEQGKSASFKRAWIRNAMNEIAPGKIVVCKKELKTFDPWFESLQRPNSGRVIICDSRDYMNMTFEQFKQLELRFKNKNIIVVCWDDPMDNNSKKIKYMCDVKVEVKDYIARIRNRFGGNKAFDIWPDRPKETNKAVKVMQPQLFANNGEEVSHG
jgi:nucleoside-triphosphatase THEP1